MFDNDKLRKEELEKELLSLKDMVSTFKINLDNGHLDLNQSIKDIIAKIKSVSELKKEVAFSKEENKKIETDFHNLKQQFTKLKGIHLHKYNEKIELIQLRCTKLYNRVIDKKLNDDIRNRLRNSFELSKTELNKSNVLINNSQWTQSRYLDTLRYDKIKEFEVEISELEDMLKIKKDSTSEMKSLEKDIEEILNKIDLNIKKGLTIDDINIYINEYPVILNRILSLETMHEGLRNIISKDLFGIYSGKIVELKNKLEEHKNKLLEEKKMLDGKTSKYNQVMDELNVINEQYNTLKGIIIDNKGNGTEKLVNVYNTRLNSYLKNLEKIKKTIIEYEKDGTLNSVQIKNINDKISSIQKLYDEINTKLNVEFFVLSDDVKESKNENNFLKLDESLNKLKNLIDDLGEGPVRDEEKRQNVELYIQEINSMFNGLDGLLSYYEQFYSEKYKKIKDRYDSNKELFDNYCKEYNGKCPLRVKMVREAKRVYSKHKKLSLISAGLASMTLLTSSYTLVPALMHGNAMLGNAIPAFNGMMSFFNKILGSMIGASIGKNGAWVLATGAVLNGAVATTSILKFLATIGVGTAALTAPLYVPQIVLLVKQLVEKIKEYDLKQKLVNTYQSGAKKVNEVVQKVEEKIDEFDLRTYYDELYNEYIYYNKGMSLDEFCEKKKLSARDKNILELRVAREKLDEEINKALGSQIKKKGTVKFV